MKDSKSIFFVLGILITAAVIGLPAQGICGDRNEFVMALDADARSLDPSLPSDRNTFRVTRNLYDPLFYRDKDMKTYPELAESFEILDDLTWLIKLRKGVKFHNGEPFNAQSVKFTIDFVKNPANKSMVRHLVAKVDRVEIIDDYTVKIITQEPFPTLLENLMWIYMAPPKLAKEKGMQYLSNNPVGTGCYKLESWSKDREIRLTKNEDYFKGPPKIDKVIFRVIPEVGPRVSALVAGEVDLIPDVPPHLIKQVNNSDIAMVKSVPVSRIIFVALDNINDGPMKDVRVRQAMNYGVDVDEIINTIMEGSATRVPSGLLPSNKHFDPTLKPYPYDPKKAKKLLAEAGYGKGLTLTLHSCQGRYQKDTEFAQAIAAQLARIGVKVQVKFHEWGTYIKMVKSHKAGDMHVLGRGDRQFEGGMLWAWFRSGNSYVNFSDPELDKELDKAYTIVNPSARAEAFKVLQAKVQELAPWIFLWQQHALYGMNNRVEWKPRADEEFYLFDVGLKN